MGEEYGPWNSDVDAWYEQTGRGQLEQAGNSAVRNLNYRPFGSQQKFHDSERRFKGFSGPVGSGKSLALVAEGLSLAYANPGVAGLIGAPTYPMLRDVTRAAFLDLLESSSVPHIFRKADNEVLLTEPDSLVLFRSLDNPTRLVGTNLAWFAVDELTYCKEDSWRRLEARLRHPNAQKLAGCAAWTPKGFDWVYERFMGESKVEGYEAIIAKPRENTALPVDFYDRLKASYDPRFYEQEALGKYLSIFAGQAYYAFDRQYNVKSVTFDPRFPIMWAMDFNVNPMASAVCQAVDGEIRVLQEIVLPNSNTLESCRVFRDRAQKYLDALRRDYYAVVPLRLSLYGDAAGNQRKTSADRTDWKIVRDFFAADPSIEESFFGSASNPTVKGRVNAMNAMLCNSDGERRMVVDPCCKELIADLEQVAWKVDAAGNSVTDLDKSNPKRTHISDAMGYLIEKDFGLRPTGGPRPHYLGV